MDGLLERVMGIEPTSSAWKAEVLPLNYTRAWSLEAGPGPAGLRAAGLRNRSALTALACVLILDLPVEGGGFEPPKAEPSDLQSDPFDHSGTPPRKRAAHCRQQARSCQEPRTPMSGAPYAPIRLPRAGLNPGTSLGLQGTSGAAPPPDRPAPAQAGTPRPLSGEGTSGSIPYAPRTAGQRECRDRK